VVQKTGYTSGFQMNTVASELVAKGDARLSVLDAVARWFDDDPRLAPSFAQQSDGTVRIDVCLECAAQSGSIRAHTQPAVEPPH
jgi:hypothetical protein